MSTPYIECRVRLDKTQERHHIGYIDGHWNNRVAAMQHLVIWGVEVLLEAEERMKARFTRKEIDMVAVLLWGIKPDPKIIYPAVMKPILLQKAKENSVSTAKVHELINRVCALELVDLGALLGLAYQAQQKRSFDEIRASARTLLGQDPLKGPGMKPRSKNQY